MKYVRINDFLTMKVRKDLELLLIDYINDERDRDVINDLKDTLQSLEDMSLEQLISINKEYVDEEEMQGFLSEYFREWSAKYEVSVGKKVLINSLNIEGWVTKLDNDGYITIALPDGARYGTKDLNDIELI